MKQNKLLKFNTMFKKPFKIRKEKRTTPILKEINPGLVFVFSREGCVTETIELKEIKEITGEWKTFNDLKGNTWTEDHLIENINNGNYTYIGYKS